MLLCRIIAFYPYPHSESNTIHAARMKGSLWKKHIGNY